MMTRKLLEYVHLYAHHIEDVNPTLFLQCLMKCFFKKTNALDFFGYPTLDGLVNLYTENVADHQYFMAVLKITNFCLKGVSIKYKINQATGKWNSFGVTEGDFNLIFFRIRSYGDL